MSDNYEQYSTVYDADTVNILKGRGWEVASIVGGTDPDSGLPAPAFVMGKPKAKVAPKLPTAADLARANSGL